MSNYKAIILDIDGTLVNSNGEISGKTKEWLFAEKDRGVQIVLATGRPVHMTIPVHEELELDTPMISLNGAVTYDRLREVVIKKEAFSDFELSFLHSVVEQPSSILVYHSAMSNYQVKNELDIEVEDYFPILDANRMPNDETIIKLSTYFTERQRVEDVISRLSEHFAIADWKNSLEITRQSVTKWHGIKGVLAGLGLDAKDAVAFGDGPNDIEMIKNVGTGVAMGNAILPLKKVADYQTTTNDEDGVVTFLRSFVPHRVS